MLDPELEARRAQQASSVGGEEATTAALAVLSDKWLLFCGYANRRGEVDQLLELIDRNPVEHVDRPHVGEDSQTLGPDRDQARALLRAADQASPRDRALAYLLAHLGLRVSEALRLTAGDVTTTRDHRTVWVTRKRGRRQQLALSPACAQALDALLAQRPDGALFVTRTGRPLDRHHAAKIIARLGRRAGLRYPLTPKGCARPSSPSPSMPGPACATSKTPPATPTHAPPGATTAPAATSTAPPATTSPATSPTDLDHRPRQHEVCAGCRTSDGRPCPRLL